MTKTTIVKVQRPIYPSDQKECLVYNEDGSLLATQVIPKVAMQAMKKRPGIFAMKAYFEGKWTKSGWEIGKMVGDQEW